MSLTNCISFLRDTKSIGELSELIVATALARKGYLVAKPIGENARYDLIIDLDEKLSRVQVKTGRLRNGAILFNTYSSHYHRKGGVCKSYVDQIDFFGVYCPQLCSVYLIPLSDTAPSSGSLRVHATKNGQNSHVRWAEPYLISVEPVLDLVVGAQVVDAVAGSSLLLPS
ncbi:MAG: hypothetical protein JO078_11650 [Candidatus Eremiobacteraeota bacterium]|nr:hypothetical protein [Candidatus Eremiobacteraeota bacterium]